MKKLVIDTGVLTLFFAGDERVAPYFRQIQNGQAEGYIASTNLAEFYYKVCQKLGRETATLRYHQSRAVLAPVETDEELTLAAGILKCRNSGLSLTDSFALALAERVRGTLLTTDRELAKVREVTTKFFPIQ